MSDWNRPQEIDDLTVVFPASVMGTLLPPREDIPEEFWRSQNLWVKRVSQLFFRGGTLPRCKKGVDAKKASRHLRAVLSSFEPPHEHKEAGAAYLMSLWFEEPSE